MVHPCVFVLGDGRRLRCPPAYARAVQSVDTLEHAKACTRLRPLAIPASWRPVLAALQKAGSCLTHQGWRVSGGPSLGDPYRRAETPIGELQVHNGTAPILIGYYQSADVARQFDTAAIRNVKPRGEQFKRHGYVIAYWTRLATSQQRNVVETCALR